MGSISQLIYMKEFFNKINRLFITRRKSTFFFYNICFSGKK